MRDLHFSLPKYSTYAKICVTCSNIWRNLYLRYRQNFNIGSKGLRAALYNGAVQIWINPFVYELLVVRKYTRFSAKIRPPTGRLVYALKLLITFFKPIELPLLSYSTYPLPLPLYTRKLVCTLIIVRTLEQFAEKCVNSPATTLMPKSKMFHE